MADDLANGRLLLDLLLDEPVEQRARVDVAGSLAGPVELADGFGDLLLVSEGGLEDIDGGDAGAHLGRIDGANAGVTPAIDHVIDELVGVGDFLIGLGAQPRGETAEILNVHLGGQLAIDQGGGELEGDLGAELRLKLWRDLHDVDSRPIEDGPVASEGLAKPGVSLPVS